MNIEGCSIPGSLLFFLPDWLSIRLELKDRSERMQNILTFAELNY